MSHKVEVGIVAVLLAVTFAFMQGCSRSDAGAGGGSAGTVSVSITDAPAYGYDHVWITVRDIWFNASDSAETEQAGWFKFPLSAPVTVDLLELGNGAVSVPVWDGIELPAGDYAQIRIFLVRTEDPLAPSAADAGLSYNNQVDVTGGAAPFPLRVPDAGRGIRLTGDFEVKENGKLKLAIDFDAGHDVVKIVRNGVDEYLLKPRLAYFDLDNAGAIVGSIDETAAGNNRAAQFVIKAEQRSPNGQVNLAKRITAVADLTGRFVLYPLAPGAYDLVVRGINYQTVIVKGVPVVKGTTPQSQPTVAPMITMSPALTPDYAVNASIVTPTGAWVNFLQTLPGTGEVPYDIRFSHFNPLTGRIDGFLLSSDPVRVGTFDPAGITLTAATPKEGNGGYLAVAGAPLYGHGPFLSVTPAASNPAFGSLAVQAPATARSVSGSIIVPQTFAPGVLDRGILFAVHGGMIVNALQVDSQMAGGGPYTLTNLPGGTADHPLPGACYGIEAFGWLSTNPQNRAAAQPAFVDLSASDAQATDLTMTMLQ